MTLGFDARVAMFGIAAAVAVGVLFGLGPAWQAARTSLTSTLAGEGRTSTGSGRFRNVVASGEVAAAVLFPCAGAYHRAPLRVRRHVYGQFPTLADELAHCIRANSAILDGEIVCLGEDGRSLFRPLLHRRDWPHYIAFDLLAIDGDDLTRQPLLERKRRLRRIMPRIPSRVLYHDHIERRGRDLFTTVCRSDLEGMVAKWGAGRYHTDGRTTSWLKIKNPDYTQIAGRHELFEHRRDKPQHRSRSRVLRPVLSYEVSGG